MLPTSLDGGAHGLPSWSELERAEGVTVGPTNETAEVNLSPELAQTWA